jgi:nucleoside-diphosphate-sugar epimerase
MGKLKQEEAVREFGRMRNLPFVVVRPGAVFAPGKRDLTGRVGLKLGRCFFHVGGSNHCR